MYRHINTKKPINIWLAYFTCGTAAICCKEKEKTITTNKKQNTNQRAKPGPLSREHRTVPDAEDDDSPWWSCGEKLTVSTLPLCFSAGQKNKRL